MGYYKILSSPMNQKIINYKGLYRSEPFPKSESNTKLIEMWKKYIQYYEHSIGITTQMSFSELIEFKNILNYKNDNYYELIYFDYKNECKNAIQLYGIDVVTNGGYSFLGDGLFCKKSTEKTKYVAIESLINFYFNEKLNNYGLLDDNKDADLLCDILFDLYTLSEINFEFGEWKSVYVFRVD